MTGSPASDGQAVPLSPVPTIFGAGQGTGPDGKPWVLLTCQTPLGTQVFHLTPDNAKVLGECLAKLGAAGALTIVPRLNGNG